MTNETDDSFREETAGLGCALDSFKEHEDVISMITSLKDIYKDTILTEKTYEKLKYTMDLYQEQPHLLDPYLDKILTSLLNIARNNEADPLLQNQAFKFLHLVTKTRGAKVIVRHMPHEIGDLQHILKLLADQDPKDSTSWETRYMLLVWLSIVVMIPIHLVRLDGGIGENGGVSTLDKILNFIKLYLSTKDMTIKAIPLLAGRFLTRPDTKMTHLPDFIDWALEKINNTTSSVHVVEKEAVLASLAQLFKHGKREDMKEHGANVLQKILQYKCTDDSNNVVRKNAFKLIQRIGLTFMRIKIAHWRYCRGSRSLASNLTANSNDLNENAVENISSEDDEEYQIPDEIEEIIEQLLKGLRDEAVIARWSSAKGIGRIAERLPKELADDVITSLLDMFSR